MTPDLDHLYPEMHSRVTAMLADPEAQALGVYVVSAFRPIPYQATLFADAVKRYGSPQAAAKWVAPPGHSDHGPTLDDQGHKVADQAHLGKWGGAVDLGIPGTRAVSGQWPVQTDNNMKRIAAKHGLWTPMTWEDWHYEMLPGWAPPAPASAPGSQMPLIGAFSHDTPATGAYVQVWQQLLISKAAQHQVQVTGSFDAATVDGTINFQRFFKIDDDGKVGPKTWATMLALVH